MIVQMNRRLDLAKTNVLYIYELLNLYYVRFQVKISGLTFLHFFNLLARNLGSPTVLPSLNLPLLSTYYGQKQLYLLMYNQGNLFVLLANRVEQ